MGERKGQNFYYPPDFDPKKHGSLNGYHGVHALRERARKLDRGILIIRFEMPYNIWCGGCKKHIGMGVRYNAEKTKVGMYYTTPIYQFRMKCHLCTNHFSIKTDPANLDYVIVEGASRQERRWDPTENGQVVPDDKSVGRKLADDAMYKLEHESSDKGKSKEAAPRISEISDIQDRVKDDYLANRMLRDKFRKKKKQLLEKQKKNEEVLRKAGNLSMDLVDECPEDVRFAQLLSLQAHKEAEDLAKEGRESIERQDIFNSEKDKSMNDNTTARGIFTKAVSSSSNRIIKTNGFGVSSPSSTKSSLHLGIVRKKKPVESLPNNQTKSNGNLSNSQTERKNDSSPGKPAQHGNISVINESLSSKLSEEDTAQEKNLSVSNINESKPVNNSTNDIHAPVLNPLSLISNYSDSNSDDSD